MHCSRVRTALSARLDGEALPPGLTARGLDEHLARCRDCQGWDGRARALTARLGGAVARPEDDPADVGADADADALLARLRSVSASPGTGTGTGTCTGAGTGTGAAVPDGGHAG
ncbi:zf-HC2 domain-containing protein [Streptomyces sp. NPDC001339]|uniref:zf-HC2 domain-containing protein n=1 Tax=Streptomyces sp. NPDC001339 TaxID=3364563 RepID=UPI0036C1A6C7